MTARFDLVALTALAENTRRNLSRAAANPDAFASALEVVAAAISFIEAGTHGPLSPQYQALARAVEPWRAGASE